MSKLQGSCLSPSSIAAGFAAAKLDFPFTSGSPSQLSEILRRDCVAGIARLGRSQIGLYVNVNEHQAQHESAFPPFVDCAAGRIRLTMRYRSTARLQRYTRRERPLRPGVSISTIDGEPGTLTAIVKDPRRLDESWALSCAHVLAGRVQSGDSGSYIQHSATVCQPANDDSFGLGLIDQVGRCLRSIPLRSDGINHVDAAAVRLTPDVAALNHPMELALPITQASYALREEQRVAIVGRSSGYSEGRVLATASAQRVLFCSTWLLFDGVAEADYQCAPGDSGAPVIDVVSGQLLGIHIAGTDSGSYGYFCRIERVLRALQLGLI